MTMQRHAEAAMPAGGWASFGHDPAHSGTAPVRGPRTGRLRWTRRLEGPIAPGTAVAGATAYAASNGGVLHAIDVVTGRDRWRFDAQGSYGSDLSTVPAVLADGSVLWPGPHQTLYAIGRDGALRWRLAAAADVLSPLVDARRGRLYVADMTGQLRAFRLPASAASAAPPRLLWSRRLASGSYGSPALGADGTVYETAGRSLFAIAANGRLRWERASESTVEVSPAVAPDGTIVFGSNDTHEYGYAPDGTRRWRDRLGGEYTYASAMTRPDGTVLFGDHRGIMTLAVARTGRVLRRYRARGQLWTAAASDRDGRVYFATRRGHVYGFTARGRRLFDRQFATTFDAYPALAPDGTLLIGGDDGILRAFGP